MNNEKTTPLTGAFYLGDKRLDTSNPETLEYVRSRFAAKPAQPVEAVDERAAFEAWVRSWMLGEGDADRALARDQFGQYTDEEIDFKYVGWMGRAALAHPRPTGAGIGTHAVIAEIAEAVKADRYVSDTDLASGVFGPAMLDFARKVASEYLSRPAAPTGEQAGEVVGYANEGRLAYLSRHGKHKGADARVCDISICSHQTHNTPVPLYSQPRPVGVPDGPLTGKYADVLVPFVALMERELHANAGKGDRPGWLSMSPATAVLEVHHHVAKLQKAVLNGDIPGVREYAADVANMSMMAVDVCGALIDAAPAPGKGGEA